MAANAPIKHHYVPQFYMRQFACADDAHKVMTLERHSDVVVADRGRVEVENDERAERSRRAVSRKLV